MNFSPKPHPLIAHWIPGSVVVILAYFWHHDCWSFSCFGELSRTALGVFLVASIATGELLDAARDITENIIEHCFPEKKLAWTFFLDTPEKKLENFENYFYTYYVLCWNFALGLFPVLCLEIARRGRKHWLIEIALAIACAIFFVDALLLREQLLEVMPHHEKKKN